MYKNNFYFGFTVYKPSSNRFLVVLNNIAEVSEAQIDYFQISKCFEVKFSQSSGKFRISNKTVEEKLGKLMKILEMF